MNPPKPKSFSLAELNPRTPRDPFHEAACGICGATMTRAQVVAHGPTCGPVCAKRDEHRVARLGAWWVRP